MATHLVPHNTQFRSAWPGTAWGWKPLREVSVGDMVAHCGSWRLITSAPQPVQIRHRGQMVAALRTALNGSAILFSPQAIVRVATVSGLPCPQHRAVISAGLTSLRAALARLDHTDPDADPVGYDHAIDHVINTARTVAAGICRAQTPSSTDQEGDLL